MPDFQFDVAEALKSGFYISGTTGCGKTDIAMYCADALINTGITCIVFDPSQDWMSRYSRIKNVIKFRFDLGPYIDNVSLGESIIIDTSQMTILNSQKLAELFCKTLYEKQSWIDLLHRKRYFLIFEEAQTEFPQGCLRSKQMQNVVRLLTQGRNYNIRIGIITQFASMVDKDAMKYCKQRYFGWTDEFNDVSYISKFMGKELAEELKFYGSGDFLYYFPTKNIAQKIHIEPHT